jgi:hypothetical protein
MIYIRETAVINHLASDHVDLRAACKAVLPKSVRRTDGYIQLGLLGIEQMQRRAEISEDTALYLASGQGNISVFNRICQQRLRDKFPPKPVEFINSLSNTAGFYIAQLLGLKSKNSCIHNHGFVVEMGLILVDCELEQKRGTPLLFGGVDQLFEPADIGRQLLGLEQDVELGEGSNWMLLDKNRERSLASLQVVKESMDVTQVRGYIRNLVGPGRIAFGLRCSERDIRALMAETDQVRFEYEQEVGFYETVILYALNRFVRTAKGRLLYVNLFEGRYRLVELNVF